MTSSGFSFNFLPTDDTTSTAAHDEQLQQHGGEQGMNEKATDDGQNVKIRLPFAWIADEDFRPLLDERSTEELVYTDVAVSGLDDASTAATSTTATSTLRCVDLSISSFQRPSESSVKSNVNNEQAVWNRTDIEPGLYEGGRKVWECSVDLVQYLIQEGITLWHPYGNASPSEMEQEGSNIKGVAMNGTGEDRPTYALELGCGHGLPGCYLLRTALLRKQKERTIARPSEKDDKELDDQRNAAKQHFSIVFTDYNEGVVLDATLSNIVLNCMDIHGTTTATAGPTSSCTSTDHNDVAMSDVITCTTSTPATTNMATTTSSAGGPSSPIGSILDDIEAHVVLGAGDWMDMSRQLLMPAPSSASTSTTETKDAGATTKSHHAGLKLPTHGKFDVILAAETLYTCEAARETALLFKRHLQPVTGVAYVATKRYYFGVNGGVNAFVSYAASSSSADGAADVASANAATRRGGVNDQDSNEYDLKIVTVKVIDNGVGNIREVLRVQCIPSSKH